MNIAETSQKDLEQQARPGLAAGFRKTMDHVNSRRHELLILLSISSLYFFAFFQRIAIPGTIFDELQMTFNTTAGVVAGLGAIYLYLYGAMQPVAGMLNDRFGAGRVLIAGGGLLALGAILFPLATAVPYLFAARALVGLGASLVFISMVKAVDELFGAALFPQYLGISMFLGYAGGLTGTYPLERLTNLVGWRPALLIIGGFGILAWLAACVILRRTRHLSHSTRHGSRLLLRKVLCNRRTYPLVIAGSINFAIYFLIQATLGKKILLDYLHLGSAAAAAFTFAMMLTGMIVTVTGGWFPRFMGNRRKPMLVFSSVLAVFGPGVLFYAMHANLGPAWMMAGYLLLAVMLVSTTLTSAVMKELNHPEAIGTAIGLYNGVVYLAVALLSNAAGFVLDRFYDRAIVTATAIQYPKEAYLVIFGGCLVLALISLVISLFITETEGIAIA